MRWDAVSVQYIIPRFVFFASRYYSEQETNKNEKWDFCFLGGGRWVLMNWLKIGFAVKKISLGRLISSLKQNQIKYASFLLSSLESQRTLHFLLWNWGYLGY